MHGQARCGSCCCSEADWRHCAESGEEDCVCVSFKSPAIKKNDIHLKSILCSLLHSPPLLPGLSPPFPTSHLPLRSSNLPFPQLTTTQAPTPTRPTLFTEFVLKPNPPFSATSQHRKNPSTLFVENCQLTRSIDAHGDEAGKGVQWDKRVHSGISYGK